MSPLAESWSKPKIVFEAIRAVGVTFGGSFLLLAATLAAGRSLTRSLISRDAPRKSAVLMFAGALAYEAKARKWMRGWGTTREEWDRSYLGDEHVPDPGVEITQAITIEAPPAEVWPWLAQLGQDRGGFYSYEWLENLAGCRMTNADRIHCDWQKREVGEEVMLHPLNGLKVTVFEPGRAFGLEGWGLFLLEPVDEKSTRFIARGRIPKGPASFFYEAFVELPHFIMQRRMLLGIKQRAEALYAEDQAQNQHQTRSDDDPDAGL
jgi:hypothetical protein